MRDKARTRRRRRSLASSVEVIPAHNDLGDLRRQITHLVSDEAVDMVKATITQVKDGQYQAMKYLFEMIGVFPSSGPEETSPEDSLARILLNHLGIAAEPASSSDSAKLDMVSAAVEAHAVK
jgi:hypothetical protein